MAGFHATNTLVPVDGCLVHGATKGLEPNACVMLGLAVRRVSLVGRVMKDDFVQLEDGTPTIRYQVQSAGQTVIVVQRLPRGDASEALIRKMGAQNVVNI